MITSNKHYWEIVGGKDSGGLLVRKAEDTGVKPLNERLSTGSVVFQLALNGQRLHYKLVSGDGPEEGWISIKLKDKELAMPCLQPLTDPMTGDLRSADPKYSKSLEEEELTIKGFKGYVTHRAKGAPRAPLAVLIVPGNPFYGYHCEMVLPRTMGKAFGDAGFPVVRFDFVSIGRNKAHKIPEGVDLQSYDAHMPLTRAMYDFALTLGKKVVVCTWNYSGTMFMKFYDEKWPQLHALVSLGFAYGQWEMVKKFSGDFAGEMLKQEFEGHSRLEIPAIYIVGDKDIHSPVEEIQRLAASRPDGGKGVEIKVISQVDQDLKGNAYLHLEDKEAEAGHAAATWVHGLRKNLLALESDSAALGA